MSRVRDIADNSAVFADGINTADVTEGSNLYFTNTRADARAQLKIDALVDSAPGALDTLNELAAALGDDANFSTTITNSIATKMPLSGGNFTGSVGIGTATPAKKLHIRDSVPDIRLEDTNTNAVVDLKGNTGTGSFVISTDVNNAIANSKIIFEVDNDEKVRIDDNGNVGIGTTSPSSLLTLHGSQPIITLSDPDSTSTSIISGNSGHLLFNADSGGDYPNTTIDFQIDNSQRMRIDSSGNVMIGTTSNLLSGTNRTTVSINNSDSGAVAFGVGGTNEAFIYSDASAMEISSRTNPMRFTTGDAERMRIDSSGNVMIGTTTAGLANNGDQLTISDSGNTGITIRSTNSGQNNIYFSDGTSGSQEYIGYITYQHDVNAMRFGANDGERMRIDSSGKVGVNADGNMTAKFTVNKPATGHTTGYQEDIAQLYTTETSYLGRHYMNFFHDNNNRDASTHHTVWGMAFGYDNNTRGGIQYDHKGQERMTLWSSYGSMQFKIPATPSATKLAHQITEDPALELKSNGNNLRPRQSAICLTLSASQGLPGSGTWGWEKINLNTVVYQKGNTSAWDSGNTRYTCPETGLYLVTTSIQMENNGGAIWRYLYPTINGATSTGNGVNFADFVPQSQPNATYYHHSHTTILKCSSGDYIEWKATGSGGGSTVKPGGENACTIYFLG